MKYVCWQMNIEFKYGEHKLIPATSKNFNTQMTLYALLGRHMQTCKLLFLNMHISMRVLHVCNAQCSWYKWCLFTFNSHSHSLGLLLLTTVFAGYWMFFLTKYFISHFKCDKSIEWSFCIKHIYYLHKCGWYFPFKCYFAHMGVHIHLCSEAR